MWKILLTDEQLNSQLPVDVIAYMGYPKGSYKVVDCIFGEPELQEDGRWLCDSRFRSWDYTEVISDGIVIKPAPGIANNNTNREINEGELDMWRQMIGKENVFFKPIN